MAAALLLAACSNDGQQQEDGAPPAAGDPPEQLALAGPNPALEALRQDTWAPLQSLDPRQAPTWVETSSAGVFVGHSSLGTESPWVGSFHNGDDWQRIDPADVFSFDEDFQPWFSLGSHSLMILGDAALFETSDGVNWSTAVEFPVDLPVDAKPVIVHNKDTTILSFWDGQTILAEWHSTEFGVWEPFDVAQFVGLEEHLNVTGDIRTHYLGDNGQRLIDMTRRTRRGPLLLSYDGTSWQTSWPFELADGSSPASYASTVFWSETLQKWIAVWALASELENLYISESVDGVNWEPRRVNPPISGENRTLLPPYSIGDRLFLPDRNGFVSTVDFVTWDRYTVRDDSTFGRFIEPLGDGQCIAIRHRPFSSEDDQLTTGPCPYDSIDPGSPARPIATSIADLSVDPESWDGMIEETWDRIESGDTALPAFALLANLACEGLVTAENSGPVRRVTSDELNTALSRATPANCDLRWDLATDDPIPVEAADWDEMIDQRVALIPHQRMTRHAFDAAAAFECDRGTTVFESATDPRYNNAEAAQITAILELDCDLLPTRVSPEWNGTLLVAAHTEADFDIYTLETNDGEVSSVQLTAKPAADHHGSFTDDGDSVIFSTETDAGFDIARIDTDGGPLTLLTSDGAYNSRSSPSPDGSRIVFETEVGRNIAISIMDSDGSNRSLITEGLTGSYALGGDGYESAWSPDGTKIAFYVGDGSSQLWVHDIETGTNRSLSEDIHESYRDFSWSPDSTQLVFIGPGETFQDGDDLWAVDINSADPPYRLAAIAGRQTNPRWSPAGSHIVFNTVKIPADDRWPQLYLFDITESSLTQLTSDPDGALFPLWAPDGSAVAYTNRVPEDSFTGDTEPRVAIVDLDGRVTLTGEPGLPLDWTE